MGLSDNRDPWVRVVTFDEIDRTVGRSVIDQNDFEILERLGEHTLKGLVDKAQRIIRTDSNADDGCGHGYAGTRFTLMLLSECNGCQGSP